MQTIIAVGSLLALPRSTGARAPSRPRAFLLSALLAACSGGSPAQDDGRATAPEPGGSTAPSSMDAAQAGVREAGAAMTSAESSTASPSGSAATDASASDASKADDDTPVTSHPGVGPMQDKPLGYGARASGGGSAQPRMASSLAELQSAVDAYAGRGGLVLEYTGSFDFDRIDDPCTQHTRSAQKLEIKNRSDLTILGRDGSAANFGIHIAGASENIIVRNMTIGLVPGGSDSDMVSLEGTSSGVPSTIWIDHNELFSSLADCPGAGDTAFDGLIDVKKGVDNLTVSYNYLHDHHKVSLNGYSDSDSQTRHITFHHNVFENVGSRTPLQRHGFSHIANNLFNKVLVSAINVRMAGYALVEANYFEDVKNPVTSRDSDEVGFWELRDNNLATAGDVAAGNRFGIRWDDGSQGTVNATDWSTTRKFPEPLGYVLQAHPWACVRDGLRAVAGSGKGLATLRCESGSEP